MIWPKLISQYLARLEAAETAVWVMLSGVTGALTSGYLLSSPAKRYAYSTTISSYKMGILEGDFTAMALRGQ